MVHLEPAKPNPSGLECQQPSGNSPEAELEETETVLESSRTSRPLRSGNRDIHTEEFHPQQTPR